MKHQRIRNSLITLAKEPFHFVEASPAFRSLLQNEQCNAEVAEILCACVVDTHELIGELFEMSESSIMKQTRAIGELGVAGFVAIGKIPNGDTVLLSCRDGSIHVLDHELLPDEVNIGKSFDSLQSALDAVIANRDA